MIENEFKLMLTEEQYNSVLAMFGWDKTFVQTNYYYDTAELSLSEQHVTCRVRTIGDKFYLQMKLPTGRDYSRVELSRELEKLPEELSAAELNSLAERGDFPNVSKLGSLTTTRSVYHFEGGEIDLDKSEYFGITDYELEIEFTDENSARQVLSEITEKLGIKPQSDVCKGKIHRFLAAVPTRHGRI